MNFQATLNNGSKLELTKLDRTTFQDADGNKYIFPADIKELRA